MKVNYTADEMRQLQEIEDKYSPKLEELFNSVYECDPDSDERFRRDDAYNKYYRSFVKEYRAKCHQFDQYYFDGIKAKGDQAVLEDGKRQIDALLRKYQQTVLESDIIQDENGVWITRENSSGKMSKEVAMESLKSELRLYFRELTGKPERKELARYMKDRVDQSPFISKEKPAESEKRQLPEVTADPFKAPYAIALGGELTNIICDLSIRSFVQESKFSDSGTAEVNGIQVKIEGFNDFKGEINTSALKLWDAITAYLAANNPHGIKNGINTHVEIPLNDYAEARGIEINPKKMNTTTEQKKESERARKRKWKFKDSIDHDLKKLSRFCIHSKRKADHDVDNLVLIYPDYSVENIIAVNLPEKTAIYLLNRAYPYYYAPELQKLNGTNPSTYRVGRKMFAYCSIDNNAKKGTNNTLKVKTLASYSPFFSSPEKLSSQDEYTWKEKIKSPIETVLDEMIDCGALVSWKYKIPRTKKEISVEDAKKLTPNEYWNLNIEFTPKKNEQQEERILQKRKEAEKRAKAKAKKANSEQSEKNVYQGRKVRSTKVGRYGLPR